MNSEISSTPNTPTNADSIADRVPQQTEAEKQEEARKIRRLQTMMNMVISVISQDENLTVEEAAELIGSSQRAALNMFPDKELAYNLIYRPRLQRLMIERFRLQ
jgi:hypothetical protein